MVGTVEEVERMIGPLDVIGGMVRDEEADGENEREANDRQGDAPARKMPPEEEIGSGGATI